MAENEQTLSPDEMAALKDVAQPEETTELPEERAAQVKVLPYNFRQPGQLSNAQLRALKVVHEYFSKGLSEQPPGGLDIPFSASLLNIETLSYGNFMGSLDNPCFMLQLASRFEQSVLMDINIPLARSLVVRMLGDSNVPEETKEPLTSVEQSIAADISESMLKQLDAGWALSSPVTFRIKAVESDPRFVQVMPDDSPVVSLTFRIRAGETEGQLTICYPLEPLQEMLEGMSRRMTGQDDEVGDEEGNRARVLGALKMIPMEIRAELGCGTIYASQLARLRPGDVFCLNRRIDEPLELYLGEQKVFKAQLGRKGDSLALQLTTRQMLND